jgi:hypothetical protein
MLQVEALASVVIPSQTYAQPSAKKRVQASLVPCLAHPKCYQGSGSDQGQRQRRQRRQCHCQRRQQLQA